MTHRNDHDGDHDDGGRRPAAPERSTVAPAGLPRCSCGGAQTAAVVLDLPTALGLADHPGELPGHGAIPGPLARRLAADRDWVAWTTDPDSRRLLGRGAGCYRPSAPLRAFIAARDRTCGFPGCPRTATDCDCDHIENFDSRPGRGGKTVPANLGPLCRQHHNAKTHGHWQLALRPRHRHQDLDQPARQDLHRRHRPTPALSQRRHRGQCVSDVTASGGFAASACQRRHRVTGFSPPAWQ